LYDGETAHHLPRRCGCGRQSARYATTTTPSQPGGISRSVPGATKLTGHSRGEPAYARTQGDQSHQPQPRRTCLPPAANAHRPPHAV